MAFLLSYLGCRFEQLRVFEVHGPKKFGTFDTCLRKVLRLMPALEQYHNSHPGIYAPGPGGWGEWLPWHTVSYVEEMCPRIRCAQFRGNANYDKFTSALTLHRWHTLRKLAY